MVNNHPMILFQAAQLLYGRAYPKAAEGAFREVLEREPHHLPALRWLATLLQNRGCHDEAAAFRRRRVALEVEQLGVPAAARREVEAFKLAAEGYGPQPARAPAPFVTAHFDTFAGSFDHHMRENLQYRGPELLREAMVRVQTPAGPVLDVLDIGCGTGLAGPLFRPWARQLHGVDLSAGMADRARDRRVYDHLEIGELTGTLADRPDRYDLILAADVLIYFGDVSPVLAGVRKALRPGGWFAFSAERGPEPGFTLGPTGRYAHGLAYLRSAATAAGLEEVQAEEVILRLEDNGAVHAHVIVLRKGT
jgi:predicted TPR repeat methyltransferase